MTVILQLLFILFIALPTPTDYDALQQCPEFERVYMYGSLNLLRDGGTSEK